MKTYIAKIDFPGTRIENGDIIPDQTTSLGRLLALMLKAGFIEEAPKKKEWILEDLQNGDLYWSHHPTGDIHGYIQRAIWRNDFLDNYRRATGNCFETEELARAAYDKFMIN